MSEQFKAEDAYIAISNHSDDDGHGGLVYYVVDEQDFTATTSITAAAAHLAYIHTEMPGYEDTQLYRLVPVDPNDYREPYEAAIDAYEADRAEAEAFAATLDPET
jgi:hypothetical protein